MNLTCAIRPAGILLGLATVVLTSLTAAISAALAATSPGQVRALSWADPPLPPGWNKHPPVRASPRPGLRFLPGWNKHPPLPGHLDPLATGGIPGWQQALIAVTIVLLAAVLVTIAYPGPGHPTAERTHRPGDDHPPRHPDPQHQPAAPAAPALARQNHRPGPRP